MKNDRRCSQATHIFKFAWRLFGSDWMQEQDARIPGDTADIQTEQLLITKRSLCPIAFCTYKKAIFPIMLFLYINILSITMNPHTAHNHSGHYTIQYKALSVSYYLL
jgi:hypothetical protein